MSYSRSTLSLVTVLLILVGLGAGVAWRLLPRGEDGEANPADSLPEGIAIPQSAGQFSTDVPQPVRGATAVRDTLWIRVDAAGQAEASRRVTLTAQASGIVESLPVHEGQRVALDSRLLQIDTTEYSMALAQARVALRGAELDFEQMTLFDDQVSDPAVREERRRNARMRSGLDQQEINFRQAMIELERTLVVAPFEGSVADVAVVEGEYVGSGTDLMTIVDLDPIKVEVQVIESQLGLLAVGRGAQVTFAAYPGERFAGRIETMNPVVDPDSRMGRVTVRIPNPAGRIKPGMYAEVTLDAEALPDRVIIPREALLQRERGTGELFPVVFVHEIDNGVARAKWRYVNPGRESDTHVELLREGPEQGFVEPGEIVLVEGHHYLGHDVPIRLVEDVAAEGGRPSR